jgi:hypothetical protein
MPKEKEQLLSKEPESKEFISWEVPEYPVYERGIFWYLSLAVVSIVLLIYALRNSNFLFAFIIVMFIIIFLLHTDRKPSLLKFSLTEQGVLLGTKLYLWKEFSRFFIVYNPPEVKTLYFEFSNFKPHLTIPLGEQNPEVIRQLLLKFLPENKEKTEEPFSDWLGRVLKI